MERYYFVTHWFFNSPVETVWKELADIESHPLWWPGMKKITIQGSGHRLQTGTCVDYRLKGSLPYTLHFTGEVVAFQPPYFLQFHVRGDLQGDLRYVLESRSSGTAVTIYWDNSTPKPIMNISAKLPFVRGLFQRNHNELMDNGYRALKTRVEKTLWHTGSNQRDLPVIGKV